MGIVIDIIAVAIIGIGAIIAYIKGFVKTFFGFVSTILAIVLACLFCNTLASYLKAETEIDDWIISSITSINIEADQNIQDDKIENSIETEDDNIEKSHVTDDKNIVNIIDSLPDTLNEMINLDEIKEDATITIANKIADMAVNILSWILIYIIVKIILIIVTFVLDGIMNISFLKTINNFAGLILGMIMGFFRVYFILAIIYFISNIANISGLVDAIQTSTIVAYMYNSNLLINLIF